MLTVVATQILSFHFLVNTKSNSKRPNSVAIIYYLSYKHITMSGGEPSTSSASAEVDEKLYSRQLYVMGHEVRYNFYFFIGPLHNFLYLWALYHT